MQRTTTVVGRTLAALGTLSLVAVASLGAYGASASAATADSGSNDYGLFGVQDPTYDGVYRDALSILALSAAGAGVDETALDWFSRQQCSNGTFTSYRADTSAPCAEKDEDSNATGLAVQAQKTVDLSTTNAVTALEGFQDADGGFYSDKLFSADPGSDANSTGIVLSAFAAAGVDPSTVSVGGNTGATFLAADQVGCSAPADQQGAYDYQIESPLAPNDYATAQATLGAVGAALPVQPKTGTTDQPVLTCEPQPATGGDPAAAAGYLARRLAANDGLIPSAFGSGADYTSTANAVISLVAAGVGADQVTQALDALEAHVDDYVVDENGDDRPGELASLILAAHAGGRDPRDFGTASGSTVSGAAASKAVAQTNLVRRLELTERTPEAIAVPAEGGPQSSGTGNGGGHKTPTADEPTALPATGGRDVGLLAVAGVCVVLVGTGLVLAGRRP